MSVYLDDRPLTDTVAAVLSVDGTLPPTVAVRSTQPIANSAGVFGTQATIAPRTIAVGLDVRPTSIIDRVATMDALQRRLTGLRLFRHDDAPTREHYVVCSAVRVEFYQSVAVPRCYVELQFTAVDPTRYEREARAVALSTSRAPLAIGTVPSAPLVSLYGASPSVVNPVLILRNASGDETHRLTLTGTLAANDALVIDAARQTIDRYVAGVLQTGTASGNAWLTSGQFPLLAPEDAIDGAGITLELTATSGTPTGLAVYTRGY